MPSKRCANCACAGSRGPACRRWTISKRALRANPSTRRRAGRRGRRRRRARCGGGADAAHLRVAVPDARVDRSSSCAAGANWHGNGDYAEEASQTLGRLGRHAEPACAARRPGPADRPARHRHRRGAHGSGRLLRPQRRRRRGRRCRAARAGGRARRCACSSRASRSMRGSRKGAAQLMEVRGGLDAEGGVAAYDFETSYPSNGAPTLALLLTRTVEPVAQAFEMGDRTARAALCLRQPARAGERHGADRARLVAARRVGAAELLRARVVCRRTGHRRRRRPGRHSGCAI